MQLKVIGTNEIIDSKDLISIGKRVNTFIFKNKYLEEFYKCEGRNLEIISRQDAVKIVKDYAVEELTRFGINFIRANGRG